MKDVLTQSKLAKLDYFRWLKADVKLRILVAANPFVAGRLLVTISPQNESLTPRHKIENKGIRALTSYPSLEIDLQSVTAAEYLVPWCGTNDAIDLTLTDDSFYNATVNIWLMSPLSVATNSPTSSVPVQVYASLANIDLRLPTPHRVGQPVPARLQVNSETPGPITEIASKISRAAGLFKDVPVVGSVASTTQWIANLTSKVASIFGWCRPVVGPTEPVANIPGRGFANFKASDASVVLGMRPDNSIVESREVSPMSQDEMSVAYACSRPGLVSVVQWKSSDDVDKILGHCSVSPDLQEEVYTTGNLQVVDATVGDYILNKFGFWRADTHFRVSLIKTRFHVGRLEVFYNPYPTPAGTDAPVDTTNCYREIFDICDRDEIEFVIPYMHSQLVQHSVGVLGGIGYLQIRVVAPLTAPDSVSDSIYLHVWKWYEQVGVAGASGNRLTTWDGSVPAKLQVNSEREKIVPNVVFGSVNSDQSLIEACSTVCGELCVNLREATRGFREAVALVDTQTTAVNLNSKLGGYLELCSNIFAFYRGGLSFKVIPKATSGVVFSYLKLDASGQAVDSPAHFTNTAVTPIHEVTVPFYTTYRRVACNVDSSFPEIYAPLLTVEDYDHGVVQGRWYAAAKDDLTFSYLIGPPALVLVAAKV
nr:MAG: hypothetical protein 1 [Aparavirus sp.]